MLKHAARNSVLLLLINDNSNLRTATTRKDEEEEEILKLFAFRQQTDGSIARIRPFEYHLTLSLTSCLTSHHAYHHIMVHRTLFSQNKSFNRVTSITWSSSNTRVSSSSSHHHRLSRSIDRSIRSSRLPIPNCLLSLKFVFERRTLVEHKVLDCFCMYLTVSASIRPVESDSLLPCVCRLHSCSEATEYFFFSERVAIHPLLHTPTRLQAGHHVHPEHPSHFLP